MPHNENGSDGHVQLMTRRLDRANTPGRHQQHVLAAIDTEFPLDFRHEAGVVRRPHTRSRWLRYGIQPVIIELLAGDLQMDAIAFGKEWPAHR